MIQKQSMNVWQGITAGFIATIPMTIFMLSTQRFLPNGQRYDLPPEIITKELAERANVKQHMNKAQILAATTASHFGYGAAMGLLYSLLGRRLPLTSSLKGTLFGLIVWSASYQALLPLLGFSESSQGETRQRNLMTIAAHVVWGACTGVVTEVLK
jgi:putative membrane protein